MCHLFTLIFQWHLRCRAIRTIAPSPSCCRVDVVLCYRFEITLEGPADAWSRGAWVLSEVFWNKRTVGEKAASEPAEVRGRPPPICPPMQSLPRPSLFSERTSPTRPALSAQTCRPWASAVDDLVNYALKYPTVVPYKGLEGAASKQGSEVDSAARSCA